jgi:parallel beta-helix repeat protein
MRIQIPRSLALGGLACLALLAAGCADQAPPLDPESATPLAAAGGPHVVQVAPPTGIFEQDRASILAALEQVRPGGTVQFAPGTYLIGNPTPDSWDYLNIAVPRITLLGHPAGTTIRGCNDPAQIGYDTCQGLLLSGGFQTVRNFTFEYLMDAVVLGRLPGWDEVHVGGYLVEDNEFRITYWGVNVIGDWRQPAVISNNRFVNVAAGVASLGSTVHVLDNHISAPEPHLVPIDWPFTGIVFFDFYGSPCEHNLIARNRIEGYENGVAFAAFWAELGCRHNTVRDNTIVNGREHVPLRPAWAIGLENGSEYFGAYVEGLVEHNLVQGNRVLGSEGQGVALYGSDRNRIVNNTITDVTMTDPFPPENGEGNGTGVWVSLQSRENQILNNTFAAIESYEVVLEGDYNHAATRSASDVVRDLGTGNRITGPGSVATDAVPAGARAAAAPTPAERAEAARRLSERFGARGLLLERKAMRVAHR